LTYFTVFIRNCFIKPNEGTFHNNDIMENYNIADHNMVFSEAQKQEILQEITIEDSTRKEKMFYDLQYGLLDTPDNHAPDDGVGAFMI
jgi:hypothetical protein